MKSKHNKWSHLPIDFIPFVRKNCLCRSEVKSPCFTNISLRASSPLTTTTGRGPMTKQNTSPYLLLSSSIVSREEGSTIPAYLYVNRDMSWYELMKIGVTGPFLDATQSLYDTTQSAVKLGNYMTDLFPVLFGVEQGCKMSPTLFSVYINDLVDEINTLNDGIDINDDVNIDLLLYAHDIHFVALIAPDEDSLQRC